MLQALCQRVDFAAHAPVHTFDLGACLKVYYAVTEQVKRLVAYLLGVVPVFEHGARVKVVPYII